MWAASRQRLEAGSCKMRKFDRAKSIMYNRQIESLRPIRFRLLLYTVVFAFFCILYVCRGGLPNYRGLPQTTTDYRKPIFPHRRPIFIYRRPILMCGKVTWKMANYRRPHFTSQTIGLYRSLLSRCKAEPTMP